MVLGPRFTYCKRPIVPALPTCNTGHMTPRFYEGMPTERDKLL